LAGALSLASFAHGLVRGTDIPASSPFQDLGVAVLGAANCYGSLVTNNWVVTAWHSTKQEQKVYEQETK
jgi:hypothetical protein